jgi:hypothetical protein
MVSVGSSDRRSGRDPSLGELVAIASKDVSLLVRQEIELAKAELGRQVTSAALGAGLLGAAAGLALGALIAVTIFFGELFAWLGLARFWSFLITAGLFLLLAAALALAGATRLRKVRPPRRAISSVREDVAMLRDRKATISRAGVGGPAVAAIPTSRANGLRGHGHDGHGSDGHDGFAAGAVEHEQG